MRAERLHTLVGKRIIAGTNPLDEMIRLGAF